MPAFTTARPHQPQPASLNSKGNHTAGTPTDNDSTDQTDNSDQEEEQSLPSDSTPLDNDYQVYEDKEDSDLNNSDAGSERNDNLNKQLLNPSAKNQNTLQSNMKNWKKFISIHNHLLQLKPNKHLSKIR